MNAIELQKTYSAKAREIFEASRLGSHTEWDGSLIQALQLAYAAKAVYLAEVAIGNLDLSLGSVYDAGLIDLIKRSILYRAGKDGREHIMQLAKIATENVLDF